MKEKFKKTRNLTAEEHAISKRLPHDVRKKFYARLMNGEDASEVMKWAKEELAVYDLEIDKFEEILESLVVCQREKLPDLETLGKAMTITKLAGKDVLDYQINLMLSLFYTPKPENYKDKFKMISYKFIDDLSSSMKMFTGNMVEYLFLGDYFSLASGVMLAKHVNVLHIMDRFIHIRLGNMLFLLAEKEGISKQIPEDIASHLFSISLNRPLNKEEISLMVLFSLMQIFIRDNDMEMKENRVLPMVTKNTEAAIKFCEENGFVNLQKWSEALVLTYNKSVWDKQVDLITKFLMKIRLNSYGELKKITYNFIQESFSRGFLSSKLIDFIFDGHTFSNASTVVLAMHSRKLKEHNLSSYIQQKLQNMMQFLIIDEGIEANTENIIDYLLDTSLNRNLNKEEISILNAYVLHKAFE